MDKKQMLSNLIKYADELKNKLSSSNIPDKHKHRVESYKDFLTLELERTNRKIEVIRGI